MLSDKKPIYDQLTRAGKRLARIPRFGRLIGLLRDSVLARLTSEAATYWELYSHIEPDLSRDSTGLIDSGLKSDRACLFGWCDVENAGPKPDRSDWATRLHQRDLVLGFLSATAFEMVCGHDGKGTSPPIDRVTGDCKDFLKRVRKRIKNSKFYVDDCDEQIPAGNIKNDWNRLCCMNSEGLRHLVFSNLVPMDSTEEAGHQILFGDISTQMFFAALWACRWSSKKDRTKIACWYLDPSLEDDDPNRCYREFWDMLLDMPKVAIETTKWQAVLSPLYDGSFRDSEGRVIRSTELIYRSWAGMKGSEARKHYEGEFSKLLDDKNAVATRLLWDAKNQPQFLQLCEGERSEGDPESLRDDGKLGERELEHYRLHRYCVTNSEYELFDTRHVSLREFEEGGRDVSRHPVVNVTWHDAWCFARWISKRTMGGIEYKIELPTEAQWKYACRCKEPWGFTWHDRRNGDRIGSGYCNFDGNHPWPKGIAETSAKPIHLLRTISVDGKDEELTVLPNPWGFHQMHGNVWEWCWDWFEENMYRALRGGSWYDRGVNCWSGRHNGYAPSNRSGNRGFRLAAVPMSQARDDERE